MTMLWIFGREFADRTAKDLLGVAYIAPGRWGGQVRGRDWMNILLTVYIGAIGLAGRRGDDHVVAAHRPQR